MLSFPKSHRIEGMIRFQFSNSDTIEGITKQEFIFKIQHNLTLHDLSNVTDQTEIFEVMAPCSTLK